MIEEWRNIKYFPKYQVSNLGRIKSFNNKSSKILSPIMFGKKYYGVDLRLGKISHRRYVHHIVAYTFLGSRPENFQISHINENPLDNRAENLCYETAGDNCRRPLHRKRISRNQKVGKSGYRGVWWQSQTKRWFSQIYDSNKEKYIHIGCFDDPRQAATAWDEMAIKLRGDGASTNKSMGLL